MKPIGIILAMQESKIYDLMSTQLTLLRLVEKPLRWEKCSNKDGCDYYRVYLPSFDGTYVDIESDKKVRIVDEIPEEIVRLIVGEEFEK